MSERRKDILSVLKKSRKPVSAASLARKYHVSRQIIVGDIALLRASGEEIEATPKGYQIPEKSHGIIHRIACRHSAEEITAEMYACVDEGCRIIDVIVDHPVYGQLSGNLDCRSRHDVDAFVRKCSESDAIPLSYLTEGVHLHTLECPDEESFQRVVKKLRSLHILLNSPDKGK